MNLPAKCSQNRAASSDLLSRVPPCPLSCVPLQGHNVVDSSEVMSICSILRFFHFILHVLLLSRLASPFVCFILSYISARRPAQAASPRWPPSCPWPSAARPAGRLELLGLIAQHLLQEGGRKHIFTRAGSVWAALVSTSPHRLAFRLRLRLNNHHLGRCHHHTLFR